MAKKHRVKRQKYVEHLLELEKKREEYLEKRRAPKRSREMRNNEEVSGEGRDAMESTSLKKRRTEDSAAAAAEEEESHYVSPRTSVLASEKAKTKATTAGAGESETKTFFAGTPFSELVKASSTSVGAVAPSASASEPESVAKAAAAKKSLKRRHY